MKFVALSLLAIFNLSVVAEELVAGTSRFISININSVKVNLVPKENRGPIIRANVDLELEVDFSDGSCQHWKNRTYSIFTEQKSVPLAKNFIRSAERIGLIETATPFDKHKFLCASSARASTSKMTLNFPLSLEMLAEPDSNVHEKEIEIVRGLEDAYVVGKIRAQLDSTGKPVVKFIPVRDYSNR